MKVENISRFKKDRFLKSLSEDEFRDRVVRPLLLRSGYGDGRDLCGPNEHGKDAIFTSKDPLGILVVTALQTKKGNLNLSGTSNKNLLDAVTQINTALETSIVLLETRRNVTPNNVMLIASGRINDAARQHIIDKISSPNILFLDSDELVPRIDENYPELWLGIEADLLPYFQAIQRSILGDHSSHETDGHDGILVSAADDISFVALTLYRTVSKRRTVRGRVEEVPHFEEIPFSSAVNYKSKRILILGDGGSGKSTGLKRVALELARRALEDDSSYRIPIVLKAVDIARVKPSSLIEFADATARALSSTAKTCFSDKDLASGSVIFMIDGLDEVGDDVDKVFVLDALDDLQKTSPKCQIILTSRPYRFISDLNQLKRYDEFRVSPISWKQAEKIVKRVTESRQIPQEQARGFLRSLEKIHGFELNPLLVTVFAATVDLTKKDIPANITELFKKFTELMLGRWDERKGLKQQYQAPLKDFVLKRLAFRMHVDRKTSIPKMEAIELIKTELIQRGHEEDVPKLLDEIFSRSGIFRVIGDNVEFQHHLLQEFFAGRGISDQEMIQNFIQDDWWRRPLVFYFGEEATNITLLLGSTKVAQGFQPKLMVEAATTIGLALQACYLSPVDEKLAVWKWVVTAFDVCQNSAIKLSDASGKYPMTSFFHYYLYTRDSVSLSHLKSHIVELGEWIESDIGVNTVSQQSRLFWLIIGLIESGELDSAKEILSTFTPEDTRFLAAIHLGCHLAKEVRPLPPHERNVAAEICKSLAPQVAPHLKQILDEMGSLLLEMRNGEVKLIDDEIDG